MSLKKINDMTYQLEGDSVQILAGDSTVDISTKNEKVFAKVLKAKKKSTPTIDFNPENVVDISEIFPMYQDNIVGGRRIKHKSKYYPTKEEVFFKFKTVNADVSDFRMQAGGSVMAFIFFKDLVRYQLFDMEGNAVTSSSDRGPGVMIGNGNPPKGWTTTDESNLYYNAKKPGKPILALEKDTEYLLKVSFTKPMSKEFKVSLNLYSSGVKGSVLAPKKVAPKKPVVRYTDFPRDSFAYLAGYEFGRHRSGGNLNLTRKFPDFYGPGVSYAISKEKGGTPFATGVAGTSTNFNFGRKKDFKRFSAAYKLIGVDIGPDEFVCVPQGMVYTNRGKSTGVKASQEAMVVGETYWLNCTSTTTNNTYSFHFKWVEPEKAASLGINSGGRNYMVTHSFR